MKKCTPGRRGAAPLFLLFFLATAFGSSGQSRVETAYQHPRILDGLHVGPDGAVYTTPGGLYGGTAIGRFVEPDQFEPNFGPGIYGGIDIDQLSNDLLVITNYDDNSLKSYQLSTGAVSTLANGLDGPAGIVVDHAAGDIYFSCFGAPQAFDGNQIYRYTSEGDLEIYVEDNLLYRPQGIAIDHTGQLYIANFDGKVYQVNAADQSLELFVDMGVKVGNMAYRQKDSCLYFPAGARIYRLDLLGNAEVIAGSTSGYRDGDAEVAQFTTPLGVAFSRSEDTLYVSEASSARRLRRILLQEEINAINDVSLKNLVLYPNPASGYLTLELPPNGKAEYTVDIFNEAGQLSLQRKLPGGTARINFENLADGFYLVCVRSGSSLACRRLIVK